MRVSVNITNLYQVTIRAQQEKSILREGADCQKEGYQRGACPIPQDQDVRAKVKRFASGPVEDIKTVVLANLR